MLPAAVPMNAVAAAIGYTNLGRIRGAVAHTLIAETTNAGSWVFPLPGRMAYKISNLAAPIVISGYLWGWRKLPSTETTAAGNRIDITTEYWLEQWSTFIYGTVA